MTPRRARFVDEYVILLDATAAAARAGFSAKNARRYAAQLLRHPDITAAIEQRTHARERQLVIDADRVVRELMRVAFSDIRRFADWKDGALTLAPRETLAPDDTAAIAQLSTGGAGQGARIRLHDKKRALRALARHVGLFSGRAYADPQRLSQEAAELRALLLQSADAAAPADAHP
ncbi:MAG TPA: terminase small subunit [Stellaceae bacterium]|nr:terminase small subunit [Stellaceae bacterium]